MGSGVGGDGALAGVDIASALCLRWCGKPSAVASMSPPGVESELSALILVCDG